MTQIAELPQGSPKSGSTQRGSKLGGAAKRDVVALSQLRAPQLEPTCELAPATESAAASDSAAQAEAKAATVAESDSAASLVRISGLYKSYGATPVLRGVDLSIRTGALTAVLGPSGSGKTTMLRLLAGFERADRGQIVLGERTVDNARSAVAPEKRRIGYVPQDGALFPHLTVRDNVGFGLPRAARKSGRIEELLDLTDLRAMAGRYPHQLSGGQQQRVALARALAPRPDLVLLDEPFSALDAALRATVRAEVLAILRATACTAILVTHDQDEALSMADRIAVLREGRVVQHGTARELYDTPADPQLACFLGEANLLDATLTPRGADLGPLGLLAVLPECGNGCAEGDKGGATALIRPEQFDVEVHGSGTGDESDEAVGAGIPGLVERCEYYGHDAMLTVRPRLRRADSGRSLPERLLVRLPAGVQLPVGGSMVTLTVRSPIAVWRAQDVAAAA